MDVSKDVGFITASIFYLVLIHITLLMVFGVIEMEASEAFINSNANSYVAASSFYISNYENDFGNVSIKDVRNELITIRNHYCKPALIKDSNLAFKIPGKSCPGNPYANISKTIIYSKSGEKQYYRLTAGIHAGG